MSNEWGPVKDRVVIITGAARGLGKAHALAFARAGAKVLINDLGVDRDGTGQSAEPANEVAEEIRAMGGEAEVNLGDVADWKSAGEMIHQAIDKWGRLDTLVLNAGFLADRMLVKMSEEEFDQIIRVHIKGHFAPARHAIDYWREQAKAGDMPVARVINTTSGAGLMGSIGQGNYVAAKAAIAALTIQQAEEWRGYGVLVNAIAPDARTRMTEGIFYTDDDLVEGEFDSKDPANASPLVVWLGSEECEVTGKVFKIDGGMLSVCDGWQYGHETGSQDRQFELTEVKEAVMESIQKSPQPAPVYGAEV